MGIGRNLLGYMASKALGVATPKEYLTNSLAKFCNGNGLENLQQQHSYKFDKSPDNPNFSLQVHFCTATLDGKIVAALIEYHEDVGYVRGCLIDLDSSLRYKMFAQSYKNSDRDAYSSFYNHVINQVDQSTTLKDSTEI